MFLTVAIYGALIIAFLIWSPLDRSDLDLTTAEYFALALASIIWAVAFQFAGGRFVRPKWKMLGKWIFYMLVSWVLLMWIGKYALIFITVHPLLGFIGHYTICKKHGINWRTSQPEAKYIALTEKWAKGDFS